MDGLTILEIITTTEETNWIWVTAIVIISGIIGAYSLMSGMQFLKEGNNFVSTIFFCCTFATIIAMASAKDVAPKKIVDLGYENIIAYVDKKMITDEQIEEKYYILSKERENDYLGNTYLISFEDLKKYEEGEIYTLRKKQSEEEISTSENVHGKQPHNWSVKEKRDKEDTVEYVLQCSECKYEKIVKRTKGGYYNGR